jgi:hypothetical protein
LRGRKFAQLLPKHFHCGDALTAYAAGVVHRRKLRREGVACIFCFAGAEWRFLVQSQAYANGARLPFDIYLVDDFEESEPCAGASLIAHIRRTEKAVLLSARRVFTISQGYSEHIWNKYNVRSLHLPICFDTREFRASGAEVRELVFFGSVNRLYQDALEEVVEVLRDVNAFGMVKYVLRLITKSALTNRLKEGRSQGLVLANEARTRGEIEQLASNAWACLLPYSFSPQQRTMVSTSFPTKLTECAAIGRPIVVYGPPYCSTARHARSNGWCWIAQSKHELAELLMKATEKDAHEEWRRQSFSHRVCNSANSVRRALGLMNAGEG